MAAVGLQDEHGGHLPASGISQEVEHSAVLPDPQRILKYALAPAAVDYHKTELEDKTGLDQVARPVEIENADNPDVPDNSNKPDATDNSNMPDATDTPDKPDVTENSETIVIPSSPGRSSELPGLVFIIGAMEKLQGLREGKRRETRAGLEQVLGVLRGLGSAGGRLLQRGDVDTLIGVLGLVETGGAAARVVALDSVEKLVSFRYFDEVEDADSVYCDGVGARLVRVVAACSAGGDAVQVQVVKALFALVSWGHVRQEALLAAMRTVVGVFVGGGAGTQTIAQGTVAQMVNVVMARSASDEDGALDAFLVVRALCRLAMRQDGDGRARCLALNLLRQALGEHTAAFTTAYVCLCAEAAKDGTQETAGHNAGSPKSAGAPAGTDEFTDTSAPEAAAEQIPEQVGAQMERNTEVAVPLIAAVRQYMSLALSRSLAAPDSMAQALGLGLFELALRHVRTYMRREMEVLLGEIVLPLVESRGAGSLAARGRMLQTLARVAAQPQLVVELYLNYDCAEDARVSVFQRLAEALCRLGGAHVGLPPKASANYAVAADTDDLASAAAWRAVQQRTTAFSTSGADSDSASLSSAVTAPAMLTFGSERDAGVFDEYAVRQLALDALAALLQSMVVWSDRLADPGSEAARAAAGAAADSEPGSAPGPEPDDPHELMTIKTRKAQLAAGGRQFALKPRKGIEAWRASGLLASNDPREVARFLYEHRNAIDKVQLGEYLGEADAHNVAVMHAFIDCMDFAQMDFVPALRELLQAFRLPGEAQKIDRFMLKFAERFLMGNPDAGFANADAAYVLSYSVVLLNTDQHSPQVKHRMTRAEFISNNRGINDGSDLDPQMLSGVFDQVVSEEIKLKDDPLQDRMQGSGARSGAGGSLFVLWGNSTANRIREQHAHASAEMAAKSEQSIRSMARPQRRRRKHQQSSNGSEDNDAWEVLVDTADYLRATRADHVAPMFGAIWTAVLAALSSPMQTSADPHVVAACLVGFQSGIALACRFRMPLERTTFVTTLRNFTQLQNLAEMRRKHVEAIRALVEVAAGRADVGDGLDANWLDVLQCVSQLEQLQLLTQGSEQVRRTGSARASSSADTSLFSSVLSVSGPSTEHSIPARAFFGPASAELQQATATTPAAAKRKSSSTLVPTVSITELAKLETNSQVLVVTVDRLFTASVRLSGAGIVDFVRALSQVAWAEIATTFVGAAASTQQQQQQQHRRRSQEPTPPSRLFSMTKIVEIAYYNMERIRVEWSQIWAILGPLFDRVGAYSDTRAALFALDSLRQLSMKFLEKEELPHFAFQKEFLRPFADILEGDVPDSASRAEPRRAAAADMLVKDMVLRCVYQLVQAASAHIRSGWKAVLNVAQIAARDAHDSIAEMGFHIARECAQHHGAQMWMLGATRVRSARGHLCEVVAVAGLEYFHELIDCLNEFAVGAAARRPRFALGAIDTMYLAAVSLGAQVMEHPAYSASVKYVESVKPAEPAKSAESVGLQDTDYPDSIALDDQPLYRVWTPVLRALYEVVMHTEDLEVRTRALDAFYRLVMTQGRHFSPELWAHVLRTLVFPMFSDLRDPSASRRFATVDDLELWFSTTLIKALRHVISLYSEYYPQQLSNAMMTEVLELLVLCIAQPSEVLGKVGTSCLQDMIRANFTKWDTEAWTLVCDTLARLFNWSQPRELFAVAGAAGEAESIQS
ncbi:guanine nucleotide exchange protein for ADP-robosylation factor, partial [Coemansia erecta]